MLIGKLRAGTKLGRRRSAGAARALGAALLLTAAGLVGASAQPAPAAQPAAALVGVDARLASSEREARFVISLSGAVEARFDTLAQPMRIIAELPEITFQSQPPAKAQGLVTSFRAGLVAPGRSRIVFDLAKPARVATSRLIQRDAGVHDLVIQFEPVAPAEFEASVARGAEERGRAALAPIVPRPGPPGDNRPLVVIDAGHGGIDSGAVGAGGILEKNLVLEIALRLRDAIERGGQARVLMTRSDDRFLSLSERVRVAREAQASLFVSLHADSLSATQEVRGATVYTASDRASDAEAARLAQKENAADAAGGADAQAEREEVGDILQDLARRETRAFSSVAAAKLVTEMSGAIRMHRIPQRSAGFRVLSAPDVPSVLIELGYLSSRTDSALMATPEWQAQAAAAVARAVTRAVEARNAN